MIIKEHTNGKVIILSKPFDTRPKILNAIYFAFFSLAAFLFVGMVLMDPLTEGRLIFIVIVGGIYLFIGFKFLNKAFQSEQILVNKETLTIIK
jgi:hypothetical protein